MYEYRCEALPEVIIGKGKDVNQKAILQYEDLINHVAKQGWEYVGIDHIESHSAAGCMAYMPVIGMFFRQPMTTTLKMAIFRRSR